MFNAHYELSQFHYVLYDLFISTVYLNTSKNICEYGFFFKLLCYISGRRGKRGMKGEPGDPGTTVRFILFRMFSILYQMK